MSENTNDIEMINARVGPVISHIAQTVPMPVKTGAASIAWMRTNAASLTAVEMRFNVNSISSLIVDREMRVSATINVNVKVLKDRADEERIQLHYGETDVLRPFPLNQTIQTCTATIGGQTLSLSQRDIFDLILKTTPKKFLSRYNSTSPSYVDSSYKNYATRPYVTLNDPLQGYEDALLSDMIPNGAFPIKINSID